jgi:hypothetical protein
MEENVEVNTGIGQKQVIAFTLSGLGPFEASVSISARLIRPGMLGKLDAIRDLILGPSLEDASPRRKIRFEAIPEKPGKWFDWL